LVSLPCRITDGTALLAEAGPAATRPAAVDDPPGLVPAPALSAFGACCVAGRAARSVADEPAVGGATERTLAGKSAATQFGATGRPGQPGRGDRGARCRPRGGGSGVGNRAAEP